MRRTSRPSGRAESRAPCLEGPLFLLALLGTAVFAQDQRPLPRGSPEVFIATFPRVHVRAHEDLDPDRLRDLARPGVTLWLTTRTNTLRASTLENVARFDTAWVQLRAPLKPFDASVFSKLPHAGAMLEADALGLAGRTRRAVVSLRGPIDEALAAKVRAAKPAEVRWVPEGEVDLLAWSQFRQLPGRRVIVAAPQMLLPVKCAQRSNADPSMELHVASLLALSSDVYPCGTGTRVVVQPEVETWLLQSLLVRDPSVELVVDVGADPARAIAARGLLERLQLGASR
ncbi:MAG: hypothetical protein Q8L48_15785 [Archangium sp.]|nr:hypothetical protein [Archangium sp.]